MSQMTLVVLDRSIHVADLLPTALSAIERKGFDVLGVFQLDRRGRQLVSDIVPDAVIAPAAPAHLVSIVDVCQPGGRFAAAPHTRGSRSVDNPRLRALSALDRVLRSNWATLVGGLERAEAPPPAQPLMSWLTGVEEPWDIVRQLDPEAVPQMQADAAARRRWVSPPFPVHERLSDWAINGRTDLVRFDGSLAVCRTFRKGREHALANETAVRGLAATVPAIAAPLATGANWIVAPYHHGHRPVHEAFGDRVPLDTARRIMHSYEQIGAHGYGLLDMGPSNVLVGEDGDIRLIDFEHVHRYAGAPPSIHQSPLAMGDSFFDDWRSQHGLARAIAEDLRVLKSYSRHWQPLAGIPLERLLHGRTSLAQVHRYQAFTRRGLTRRASTARGRVLRDRPRRNR